MAGLTFPEKKRYLELLAIPDEKMQPEETRLLLDLEEKRKAGEKPQTPRRGDTNA